MNLEDIMQVMEARHKRLNSVELHSYEVSSEVKLIGTESRMVFARGGAGERQWGVF